MHFQGKQKSFSFLRKWGSTLKGKNMPPLVVFMALIMTIGVECLDIGGVGARLSIL